jgi:formylglycine-generating enzyme required for sulfatase activity
MINNRRPSGLSTIVILSGVAVCAARGLPASAAQKDAQARAGELRMDNRLKMKFAWCPAGHLVIGSSLNQAGRAQAISASLTSGFWLGIYEVTQEQWEQVIHTTPWHGQLYVREGVDYPATYISWTDAMHFCTVFDDEERRAGRVSERWQYTLPSETQWEYACRAGTTTLYSFGDREADLAKYAWYEGNAWSADEQYPHRVGGKEPNAWGLFDMHGNVWEWCRDWRGTLMLAGNDPVNSRTGSVRVQRGGSWNLPAKYSRSGNRSGGSPPEFRNFSIGFRVVLAPLEKASRK